MYLSLLGSKRLRKDPRIICADRCRRLRGILRSVQVAENGLLRQRHASHFYESRPTLYSAVWVWIQRIASARACLVAIDAVVLFIRGKEDPRRALAFLRGRRRGPSLGPSLDSPQAGATRSCQLRGIARPSLTVEQAADTEPSPFA